MYLKKSGKEEGKNGSTSQFMNHVASEQRRYCLQDKFRFSNITPSRLILTKSNAIGS